MFRSSRRSDARVGRALHGLRHHPPPLRRSVLHRRQGRVRQGELRGRDHAATKSLLDQYPFDPHAEEAELTIAESHYKKKQYAEAIAAFNDFQRMHPMSPELAKIYYLLGKSYEKQMTTIDRDQGAADNAQGWYRVVLDRYPESPYAPKARRRMAKCRESMAGHERYVAMLLLEAGQPARRRESREGPSREASPTRSRRPRPSMISPAPTRNAATRRRPRASAAPPASATRPSRACPRAARGRAPRAPYPPSARPSPTPSRRPGRALRPERPSRNTVAAPALIDPVTAAERPTGGDPHAAASAWPGRVAARAAVLGPPLLSGRMTQRPRRQRRPRGRFRPRRRGRGARVRGRRSARGRRHRTARARRSRPRRALQSASPAAAPHRRPRPSQGRIGRGDAARAPSASSRSRPRRPASTPRMPRRSPPATPA